MSLRQIQQRLLSTLHPHPRNSRTHSKKHVSEIVDSFDEFGVLNPVIVNGKGVILAGHGRYLAALRSERKELPVIVVDHLTEAQERAYVIADNKLTENAGWDLGKLAIELKELQPLLETEDIAFEILGFEPAQVDRLLEDHVDPEIDPIDQPADLVPDPVTRLGDLWKPGGHRLLCGDARNPRCIATLMGKDLATMVFADSPYNLKVSSLGGRGRTKHREFKEASGEKTSRQFTNFLCDVFSNLAAYSADGSIHFQCMDWRHQREMLDAGEKVYTELKNLVVWVKTNAGQGAFYRSKHELIFIFKKGEAPHINTFELGQHGRHRSNVWTYAGVNTFRKGRMEELTIHPTVKPVAMVADAMRDCSRRGDIVLDPFLGSGTTIMAAERVGRRCYGLEIDPLYVDAAIRRWQAFTKRDAVLEGDGRTFDEIAAARASEAGGRHE